MCAFKYYVLIRFNPNYSTHFHNILKRTLCKNILKTCKIKKKLTIKHEKPNVNYTCVVAPTNVATPHWHWTYQSYYHCQNILWNCKKTIPSHIVAKKIVGAFFALKTPRERLKNTIEPK